MSGGKPGKHGFSVPTVQIPAPGDDQFSFDLTTTTWSQLVDPNSTRGAVPGINGDGFDGYARGLTPLANPGDGYEARGFEQGRGDDNYAGNAFEGMFPPQPPGIPMLPSQGSRAPPKPSLSGLTPSMGGGMSETPRDFFSHASPTFQQMGASSMSFAPENFWAKSTTNADYEASAGNPRVRAAGGSSKPSGSRPAAGKSDGLKLTLNVDDPNRPLSTKGRMLFFQHMADNDTAAATTSTTTTTGRRSRSSNSEPRRAAGGQPPLTNKQQCIILAAQAAKIASNQYPGSPYLVEERRCKCKKSRCLKLYCECFAAHVYCTSGECGCFDCNNLSQYEGARVSAIESALIRNPDAFTNKVTKAEKRAAMTSSTGCNCKKSLCLKKYCECFFTGMVCTGECKCSNCENYMGSTMLGEKREQMRLEEEQADLVEKVGVVAASAIRSNNVNVEAAKQQALEISRAQNRKSQARPPARNKPNRAYRDESGGSSGGGGSPDINSYDFALQMNGLDMSAATPPEVKRQPSYKAQQPAGMNLGLTNLSEEDWAFAAGAAAESMGDDDDGFDDMDPDEFYKMMQNQPDSTTSLRGGERKKKGRMFSPRTTDVALAAGARGGGGGSTKNMGSLASPFNFTSTAL
jgi:hypothetical protein